MLKVEIITQNKGTLNALAPKGQSFLDLFFHLQLSFHKYFCAGTGLCGNCALQFVSQAPPPEPGDQKRFSPEQIAQGWRLACKHVLKNACIVRVFEEPDPVPQAVHGRALLIDLGTTQIKWTAWNTMEDQEVYGISNPQLAIGADVMSRVLYALKSTQAQEQLQRSLLSPIQKIIDQVSSAQVMGIAGNSVMMSLLLGLPLQGLAAAPYSLTWTGGAQMSVPGLDLGFYVPPLLGPFVGADVSAGMAYIQSLNPTYPYLFIDVGTNAEFVLAVSPTAYWACSVPMGPAIEGVGLACGAMAGEGVLTTMNTAVHELWAKDIFKDLVGISGSGYLALIAELFRVGVLDHQGHFVPGSTPLSKKIFARLQTQDTGRFLMLHEHLFIAERDIEEVLKVKAVFSLAIKILLTHGQVPWTALQQIYLSGSFGSNINIQDLLTMGFLPLFAQGLVTQIPHTVLQGLFLTLTHNPSRQWLEKFPSQVSLVDIVLEKDFNQQYAQAMCLGWV